MLETYTTAKGEDVAPKLPSFLEIEKEVTGDPSYSMYNLSLKAEWSTSNFQKNAQNVTKNIIDPNGYSLNNPGIVNNRASCPSPIHT